jgi:uncharacterized protein YndB with AHSA1/START domain
MTVTALHRDPATLTMTVQAEFDASVERVWLLWADPRQLERWWGPPTYPATVEQHDLSRGGTVTYFMTGPSGDRHRGWWRVIEVEEARLLVVEDGFADEHGKPSPALPTTRMRVELGPRDGGGTQVIISSIFGSLEQMDQLVAMGMEQGLKAAMGQMDGILAD